MEVRLMSSDFPKRLVEKLKAIREHSKLSPDEFALAKEFGIPGREPHL